MRDYLFPLTHLHKAAIFPLPMLYPLFRRYSPWVSEQDVFRDDYSRLIGKLRQAFDTYPPLLYAAGHEHSLQVLDGNVVDYVLVSGSAAKTTPVGHGPQTIFAQSQPGFMVLDFLVSGRTRLRIVARDGGEVYAMWLRRRDNTSRE